MATEIERKFLVNHDGWRNLGSRTLYRQGYLVREKGLAVRVRIAGETGYLTIKGATVGVSRLEYEYTIPVSEAREMLDNLCDKPIIEKFRYSIEFGNLLWEIDEFLGENEGLILAEVELSDENQPFDRPDWIGEEVSGDPRYYNANLVKNPFSQWGIDR
ncbi:MAG: CYTH domain-containing protein [Cyanobacteria bacterium SID2]|nr:CYTH domain-containing protein [Cyanobacteria bacterium SID2]MBP0006346.1 CYTH domain-containing protein [Cyanobacteria bacterium SBC]